MYQEVIKEVEKEVVRYEADPTVNTKIEDLQREKEKLNGTVLDLRKQVCVCLLYFMYGYINIHVCVHCEREREREREREMP